MEKLRKNKESNPFKVPEDYFAQLNERIIANCSESNTTGSGKGIISIRPFLTLAAVISGAAIITFAILSTLPSGTRQKTNIAEILIDADDHTYDDIDIFMIESAFMDMPAPVEPQNDFSDDEIIEYLLTEQVEMSLLYEHFGDGVEL